MSALTKIFFVGNILRFDYLRRSLGEFVVLSEEKIGDTLSRQFSRFC